MSDLDDSKRRTKLKTTLSLKQLDGPASSTSKFLEPGGSPLEITIPLQNRPLMMRVSYGPEQEPSGSQPPAPPSPPPEPAPVDEAFGMFVKKCSCSADAITNENVPRSPHSSPSSTPDSLSLSPPHSPLRSPPHSPLRSPPHSPPRSPPHSPPYVTLQSPPNLDDATGFSGKKCYCSTAAFPAEDPLEHAKRQFKEELDPVRQTLSELQRKVRSMHMNEMSGCICGALFPDNVFPKIPTCQCPATPDPPSNNWCPTCGRNITPGHHDQCKSKGRGHHRRSHHKSQHHSRHHPFHKHSPSGPRCGAINYAESSSGSSFAVQEYDPNKPQHMEFADSQTSDCPHHTPGYYDSGLEQKPDEKSNSKCPERREAVGPRCPKSTKNLQVLARDHAFYGGPVSHYLNNKSKAHCYEDCGCPSEDSLTYSDIAMSVSKQRAPCARQEACSEFPLRPGQAIVSDPDDQWLLPYGRSDAYEQPPEPVESNVSNMISSFRMKFVRSPRHSKHHSRHQSKSRRSGECCHG